MRQWGEKGGKPLQGRTFCISLVQECGIPDLSLSGRQGNQRNGAGTAGCWTSPGTLLGALWLQYRLEQNIDLEIYCRWVFSGTNVHYHWWDMLDNKFCPSWNLVFCIAVWEHEHSSWQCALIFNHDRAQGLDILWQLNFSLFSSSFCILNYLAAAKNG